jgi:hypothetical protein
VERENPWLGQATYGANAQLQTNTSSSGNTYLDSGKSKGKGKGKMFASQNTSCWICGMNGHLSKSCPAARTQPAFVQQQPWGAQPALGNWAPQVVQPRQMIALASAANTGGKGEHLAVQVQNAFGANKGGKGKGAGKGKFKNLKGY